MYVQAGQHGEVALFFSRRRIKIAVRVLCVVTITSGKEIYYFKDGINRSLRAS